MGFGDVQPWTVVVRENGRGVGRLRVQATGGQMLGLIEAARDAAVAALGGDAQLVEVRAWDAQGVVYAAENWTAHLRTICGE